MRAEAAESTPPPAHQPTRAEPSASARAEAAVIAASPVVEQAPVVFEPAPLPAPVPAPRAFVPQAAQVDARAVLESAGLRMVETDRSKVALVLPEEPPVQLGRPRRERSRPVVEEPLQQVETKN